MSSFPRLDEPLTDGQVMLRDYEERDIPEILIAYQDDPRLHAILDEGRPPTGAELGSRAEREALARAAGHRATLTILEAGSDTCRGQVKIDDPDWDQNRTGLTIWLAPQVRGRGIGRRALKLTGRWLIDTCGLARVEMLADPSNAPVIHAAQAAGFVPEGVLRGYHRRRGARVDAIVLSLIPADLPAEH